MKPTNGQRPWMPADDALLGTGTDNAIAVRIGRTRGAVKARRFALGIEPGRKPAAAAAVTPLEQLAQNIAAARKAAGLTQAEAAERAGIGVGEWKHYEAGTREPKALRLKAIAAALRARADRLLAWRLKSAR